MLRKSDSCLSSQKHGNLWRTRWIQTNHLGGIWIGGWLLSTSASARGSRVVAPIVLLDAGWWIARLRVQGSLAWETHDSLTPRSEGDPCRQLKEAEWGPLHPRILIYPLLEESVHQAPSTAGTLGE